MDRLERLTQRLAEELDQQDARSVGADCITPAILEAFVSGTLDEERRAQIDSHLDSCLSCLNRFVAFRDSLQGLAAPGAASPRLRGKLGQLIDGETGPSQIGLGGRIRAVFAMRIPIGVAAAGAAIAVFVTWVVTSSIDNRTPRPAEQGRPLLTPLREETGKLPEALRIPGGAPVTVPRRQGTGEVKRGTVTGIVTQVRDAKFEGMEAHLVMVRDATGSQYTFFAWGPPTAREGDSVRVDGTFQKVSKGEGPSIYRGVAITVRRGGSR